MPEQSPALTVPEPLAIGAQLWPGYEVMSHINRSLDADVYEVWSSTRLARCVAKVVLPSKNDQPRANKRLSNEGRLLRTLTHPSIVRALSVRSEPTGMVLEHLPGISVHEHTKRYGDLSWRALTGVGLSVTGALHHLHRSGYLHLDLKPENIMLHDDTGTLIDLNLARPPGPGRKGVGSAMYMAPEQVSGADLTAATDIFALGMTLFVAASCALPAEGDEQHPHLHNPMRSITTLRNLPRGLSSAIDSCLSLDPAQRPTTRQLHRQLRAVKRQLDELESR